MRADNMIPYLDKDNIPAAVILVKRELFQIHPQEHAQQVHAPLRAQVF